MKKNSWFKPRKYIHFDSPLSEKNAIKIATNSAKVSSHSFYPLITYDNIIKKLYKEEGTLKFKDKIRPISYASHVDSAIYSYYSKILSDNYENLLSEHGLSNTVTAFRSLGKSNIDFAKKIFYEIEQRKYCSAIALDVTGFFDNLDHAYLKKMWEQALNKNRLPCDHYAVFKSITQFSTVNRDELYLQLGISKNNPKNSRHRICTPLEFRQNIRAKNLITKNKNLFGIPQGSPISAILSNIYMLDFDKTVNQYVSNLGGSYYRYCDDMMILIKPEERDDAIDFVTSEILKLELSINQDKTEIANFSLSAGQQVSDRSLQYLGFTFDGQRILLRSAALARFSAKMKAGVKLAKLTRDKHNTIRAKKGLPEKSLYKHKIYERYSHLGSQNFLTYGFRAANKMDSKHIKKQLKPLWKRLQSEIEK